MVLWVLKQVQQASETLKKMALDHRNVEKLDIKTNYFSVIDYAAFSLWLQLACAN